MMLSDFAFELPSDLIAQVPKARRSASKLLCMGEKQGEIAHRNFDDLPHLLNPGDLLILNDTRVIPARLFGKKATGGKVELLLERILDEHHALLHIRSSKSPKAGTHLLLDGDVRVEVKGRADDLFEC